MNDDHEFNENGVCVRCGMTRGAVAVSAMSCGQLQGLPTVGNEPTRNRPESDRAKSVGLELSIPLSPDLPDDIKIARAERRLRKYVLPVSALVPVLNTLMRCRAELRKTDPSRSQFGLPVPRNEKFRVVHVFAKPGDSQLVVYVASPDFPPVPQGTEVPECETTDETFIAHWIPF